MNLHMYAMAPVGLAELSGRRAKKAAAHQGKRRIPQEDVRAMRVDAATMSHAEIAAKYGVSRHYVYQIVCCGLRSDERE